MKVILCIGVFLRKLEVSLIPAKMAGMRKKDFHVKMAVMRDGRYERYHYIYICSLSSLFFYFSFSPTFIILFKSQMLFYILNTKFVQAVQNVVQVILTLLQVVQNVSTSFTYFSTSCTKHCTCCFYFS